MKLHYLTCNAWFVFLLLVRLSVDIRSTGCVSFYVVSMSHFYVCVTYTDFCFLCLLLFSHCLIPDWEWLDSMTNWSFATSIPIFHSCAGIVIYVWWTNVSCVQYVCTVCIQYVQYSTVCQNGKNKLISLSIEIALHK